MKDFFMIQKIDKIFIFIISYLIFSNVVNYSSAENLTSLNTVHLFLLTAVFTSYMVFKKPDLSFLSMKLNWWLIFYLCIILFWFILPHNEFSIGDLRRKILSIASIFIFMIFIFFDDKNTSIVRKAVFVATLVSVFNNIYEFIDPYAFFDVIMFPGRSSGFYLNPSVAGKVMVIGVIFSITMLKKEYRAWFLFFAMVGVFLTFSRAAILGLVLVYLYMIIKKQLDFKYSVFIPILFFTVLNLSMTLLFSHVETTHKAGARNVTNRIMWFKDPTGHTDFSVGERQDVANKAFDMFAKNTFFGTGLGSTKHWDARVSTHNIYLTNMAEFGLIGILIFPLLIYSIIQKSRDEAAIIAGIFAIFILFMGFFAHTLLDELDLLFVYALMANLSYKSWRNEYG